MSTVYRAFVLSVALGGSVLPSSAVAQISYCNATTVRLQTAIGYVEHGTWYSRGWLIFEPGECAVVLSGPLRNRYYYSYAKDTNDRTWSGESRFCVQPEAFLIDSSADCDSRGYEEKGFAKFDIGTATSFTQRFTCSDCPTPKAESLRSGRQSRNPYMDQELAEMMRPPSAPPPHPRPAPPPANRAPSPPASAPSTRGASHGSFKCAGAACGDIELSFANGCHNARNIGGRKVSIKRGPVSTILNPGDSWQVRNPFGGACLTIFIGDTTAEYAQ
jgi:uncharacterized membrane protein